MLLLLPGGSSRDAAPFLDQLDAAAAPDSGHRDIDILMQRQMRMLANELKQQERDSLPVCGRRSKTCCCLTTSWARR